jgi:hypothetical protein
MNSVGAECMFTVCCRCTCMCIWPSFVYVSCITSAGYAYWYDIYIYIYLSCIIQELLMQDETSWR